MSATTKTFEIPASVKAANIKRRFQPATEQPKGAPTPAVKDDLINRIGTANKHDVSDGLSLTVDVFPDFRWILMSLMYYSSVFYSSIDIKNRSKTSPLTVCMYFLVLLHAHLLVSDLFLRHTPSFWANQFMNDSSRREYLEFILALPVPDILMKFIEALTTTSDPRRPQIQVCATAAGFSFFHDFGRFFSPVSFLQAHTLSATVSARGDTEAVISKFFDMTAFGNTKNGSIFGQHLSCPSHTLDYSSKLMQSFTALFNPVIERSIQRRNTLAPTYVTPFAPTDKARFNPYIVLLHATSNDISEMQTVLESVSAALSSVLSFKGQLGSIYDNLQGLDILRHGYSSFALPTWHNGTISIPTASKPIKVQNHRDRASTLKFLQPFTPENATDLRYPSDESTINKILYLVKKVTKTDNFPSHDDFRTFHPRYDVNPRLRVLDPYDLNVSTLSSVIHTGLIIESLEVDGSIVLQPDVDSTLDECNSQLLQSAVPLHSIRRATSFTGNGNFHSRVDAINRVQHLHASQKASISLYDAGENRLGVFDLKVDEPIPTELPAFRVREHTSWFSRMYNVIAYKTTSPESSTDDTATRVSPGSVIAWSPYRYVSQSWKPDAQASNAFMLLNWRTVYGMNVPLAEIAHPSDLIPIN